MKDSLSRGLGKRRPWDKMQSTVVDSWVADSWNSLVADSLNSWVSDSLVADSLNSWVSDSLNSWVSDSLNKPVGDSWSTAAASKWRPAGNCCIGCRRTQPARTRRLRSEWPFYKFRKML